MFITYVRNWRHALYVRTRGQGLQSHLGHNVSEGRLVHGQGPRLVHQHGVHLSGGSSSSSSRRGSRSSSDSARWRRFTKRRRAQKEREKRAAPNCSTDVACTTSPFYGTRPIVSHREECSLRTGVSSVVFEGSIFSRTGRLPIPNKEGVFAKNLGREREPPESIMFGLKPLTVAEQTITSAQQRWHPCADSTLFIYGIPVFWSS